MDCFYLLGLFFLEAIAVKSAVLVPPWGDPIQNPCASKPNGWQLLYWPPDEKCYRIFQKGYPCPETMELTPGKGGQAECQCPPGTAQSPRDAICHKIFTKGPCEDNEYFAPVTAYTKHSNNRWGACFQIDVCKEGEIFWPKDGKCFPKYSQGPCPDGLLFHSNNMLGECICDNSTMQSYFWSHTSACYEHFIQGPCEKGQVFLPGGQCGCDKTLKEFFPQNELCYAIGSVGPCNLGHNFVVGRNKSDPEALHGRCACKESHVLWEEDGNCYKPFSRGPCPPGKMFEVTYTENKITARCAPLPCSAGKLYFQGGKGCHKVGTEGPCPPGQVVLFQEPSVKPGESISYLGTCGCQSRKVDPNSFYPTFRAESFNENGKCPESKTLDHHAVSTVETLTTEDSCGFSRGMVLWADQTCQQLYTQGPCEEGEWVVPDRGKGQRKGRGWRMGKCECRPTYTTVTTKSGRTVCQPPSVEIAKFLSLRFKKSQT